MKSAKPKQFAKKPRNPGISPNGSFPAEKAFTAPKRRRFSNRTPAGLPLRQKNRGSNAYFGPPLFEGGAGLPINRSTTGFIFVSTALPPQLILCRAYQILPFIYFQLRPRKIPHHIP
ncbi:MAG: hypothetical protein Q4C79_07605 [Neisseria sp.]|nr:hypothetical protein [Neisseria sp.]MDO4248807.1 hypothetical protein [Neisseria sp.]